MLDTYMLAVDGEHIALLDEQSLASITGGDGIKDCCTRKSASSSSIVSPEVWTRSLPRPKKAMKTRAEACAQDVRRAMRAPDQASGRDLHARAR